MRARFGAEVVRDLWGGVLGGFLLDFEGERINAEKLNIYLQSYITYYNSFL